MLCGKGCFRDAFIPQIIKYPSIVLDAGDVFTDRRDRIFVFLELRVGDSIANQITQINSSSNCVKSPEGKVWGERLLEGDPSSPVRVRENLPDEPKSE